MKLKALLVVFALTVLIPPEELFAQTFQTGKIAISLSNFGRVRVIKDSLAGLRQIDRSSFLAAVNPNYVFSYLLSAAIEESSKTVSNPQLSDYELYCSLNNTYDTTGQSPNFWVKHNVYGWSGGGYVLVKFTIVSRETVERNTVLGMEIIPQVDGTYGLESIEYLPLSKIISIFRLPSSSFTGYKLLSHNLTSLTSIDWYAGYNSSNPNLFNWLTYGQIDTLFDSGGDGAVTFFSKAAENIIPGSTTVMWVGISVGNNESEMIANMLLAEQKYNLLTSIESMSTLIPSDYVLGQNFPNPFNPETSIRFAIPKREFVSLRIFNSLGQEVALLLNKEMEAGTYDLKFDASELTSGVYFYSLYTGNFVQTKKMILIR